MLVHTKQHVESSSVIEGHHLCHFSGNCPQDLSILIVGHTFGEHVASPLKPQ